MTSGGWVLVVKVVSLVDLPAHLDLAHSVTSTRGVTAVVLVWDLELACCLRAGRRARGMKRRMRHQARVPTPLSKFLAVMDVAAITKY